MSISSIEKKLVSIQQKKDSAIISLKNSTNQKAIDAAIRIIKKCNRNTAQLKLERDMMGVVA